jgi:hypothetical protein
MASVDTLFTLKTLLIAERRTLRDLYDLYWLIKHRGYDFGDMVKVFQRYRAYVSPESIKHRLMNPPVGAAHAGLAGLPGGSQEQRTDEEWAAWLGRFFSDRIDHYEQRIAAGWGRDVDGRTPTSPTTRD